jgi:hypothetical protein
MSNAAAFGLGVGVGFALSLARLTLWASRLRPNTRRTKLAVAVTTILLIPAIVSFAMPTFNAGLIVWFGAAAGTGIATPIVLPLAHLLAKRHPETPSDG